MDEALLTQILLNKKRPNVNIGESLRALGYGMGGRASEYKPMGGEQKEDNTLSNYLMKAMIDRSQPMSEADRADLEYKKLRLEQLRKEVAGSQVPNIGDDGKKILQNQPSANRGKKDKTLEESLIGAMAGLVPPENLPIDTLSAVPELVPKSYGQAEGGEVIGQQGEYLPGYEPEPRIDLLPQMLGSAPDIIRSKFGISQGEASRKAFGMGRQEKQKDAYENIDILIRQLQKNGQIEEARYVERNKDLGLTPEEIYIKLEERRNAPE